MRRNKPFAKQIPPLNDEMVRGLPRQAEGQNKATVFGRKLSLYFV